MAAYAQFGYGGYPSASQLLSTNVAQSPQTGDTPTAQSTIPSANAPALSPAGGECRTANIATGGTDVSTGALSPDALSQNSNTAGASSAVAAGPSAGGSVAITATAPPMNNTAGGGSLDAATLGNHVSVSGGSSCCENGRPIMTDPVSGQTVCSCQYDSARLALSSYSRLPASSVGVYGTPYPSTDQNPYQSIGVDSSAFYSPLSNPYALKDSATGTEMTAWTSAGLQPTTGYYSYDPMSAYGYGASYDLAARRKNATRESTATLKAWLNEHKKNPYPTKGEKIMLAIITKMTLTQVSTWFANARRRLKKENKMTWEPKNRTDDDDDAMVSDDEKDKEDVTPDKAAHTGSAGMGRAMGMGGGMSGSSGDHRKDHDKDEDDLTDEEQKPLGHPSDMRSGGLAFPGAASYGGNHPHGYHPYHQHPAYYQHQQAMLAASYHSSNGGGGGSSTNISNNNNLIHKNENNDPKNQLSRDCGVPIPATKPKIWSLADTVACKTPPPLAVAATAAASFMGQGHQDQQQHPHTSGNHNSMQLMQQQQPQQQQQQPHHMTQMQQQHMMSNFAAMPYSRAPTTAYGGFLGATAQQLHTTNNIPPYNNISNSSSHNNNSSCIINHSNSSSNNSGTNTPTIPITINPLTQQQHHHHHHQQQQQHQQHPTSRQTTHHLHPAHAAGQRTAMGFPEAQPDTPPQTPPNMKVQSVAANLLFTASQAPTIATCRSTNNNNNINYGIGNSTHSYAMNYSTRYSEYSPRDESSSGGSSCSSESPTQLQQNEATFKPLFKSQQLTNAGFVPPV